MVYEAVETRGEARKRKNRERARARRADLETRTIENERRRERQREKRADPNNREFEKEQLRAYRKKLKVRSEVSVVVNQQDEGIGNPVHVAKMDDKYMEILEKYVDWPQQVPREECKKALAEFREKVHIDELRESACAICSELCPKSEWQRVSVKRIDLSLLEAPIDLTDPAFQIDFHYGHPYIDNSGLKVLFDRAGFIYNTEDLFLQMDEEPFDLRICNTCYKLLQDKKIPPLSLASIWVGPTPSCLQDLSIPEQLLISPGYLCVNIVQLSNKRHNHHKLKGHVVTLPQNPSSLMNVLPLPMYRLCEYLKVVFTGQGKLTECQLKKVFQVRKSKVVAALRWLVKHNVLFRDIVIDEEALNALPEGDIPQALRVTTTVVDIDPRRVEHYTGYVQDPVDRDEDENDSGDDENDGKDCLEDDVVNGTRELRSSGILNIDSVPVSERERALRSIQGIVESRDGSVSFVTDSIVGQSQQEYVVRMPHLNTPMSEFYNTSYFPAAFPVLFPYGCGGHDDSRRISLASYAEHLMRQRDPKFRQHQSYSFVIFDVLQRREVLNQCRVMAKGSSFARSAELISTLIPQDMKIAIEQEEKKQPITNAAVLELLRNVKSVGSELMVSHQSRLRMRNENVRLQFEVEHHLFL